MTIGVPDTLESSNDKFLTYRAVLYLFATQGVELMWSQIPHINFIPHDESKRVCVLLSVKH